MPEPQIPVLVSACLVGCNCRYDGRHNLDEPLEDLLAARGEVAFVRIQIRADGADGGVKLGKQPAIHVGAVLKRG